MGSVNSFRLYAKAIGNMNNKTRTVVAWLRSLLKMLPVVLGLAGLALVIAWISGIFIEKIQPGETRPAVRMLADEPTDEVHEVVKDYIEEAVGTLKAASRSEISTKIMATIEQIHVSAGDFVNEGDLLVTLNTQELNARLNQAKEALSAAEAATSEAESDFQRTSRLLDAKAVSQREFDESQRRLKVAEANERQAQQAANEAEVLLSYSTIYATKSGRIVDRTAEPGDTAQPGKPILALYDSQSLRLETPVLEQLAVKLKVGQKLNVKIDSIGQQFTATIDEIVPQADAVSRSFLVKASLPPNDNLYQGMFGRLEIPAGSRRHLCLSTDAIIRIGQLEFVDVVQDDGSIQRRLIKTGRLGMPGSNRGAQWCRGRRPGGVISSCWLGHGFDSGQFRSGSWNDGCWSGTVSETNPASPLRSADEPQDTESLPFLTRVVSAFLRGDVAILFTVISLAIGGTALMLTPREEEPQIIVPMADLMIEAPGLSAGEIERQVTQPLEKLLYQIDGVEYVYSMSQSGRSVVTVRFYVGEDREDSLVKLYNKVNSNLDLIPPFVTHWIVKPIEIDDVPIVIATLWTDRVQRYGDHELHRIAQELQNEIAVDPGYQSCVGGWGAAP